MFHPVSGRFGGLVTSVLLCTSASCASVPPTARAQYRRDLYFATPRELSPRMTDAMRDGHVVTGMTMEQVWVVVGDPVRKSAFRAHNAEIWVYPAARFHQDHLRAHGAASFRLVFVDGVLRIIDPI